MHQRLRSFLSIGLVCMVPILAPASPTSERSPAHPSIARSQWLGLLKECRALAALRIPYVYGGTSDQGMDCSASVQRLYRSRGIFLPRTSENQANALAKRGQLWRVTPGESEVDVLKRLLPGELIFWVKDKSPNRISHVMVFIGMDGNKAKLWGARSTGARGLTGSGVDFFHYRPGSRRNSRIVAHGLPRPKR